MKLLLALVAPAFAPAVGDPPCEPGWWAAAGAPSVWIDELTWPEGLVVLEADLGGGPELWVGGAVKFAGHSGLLRRTSAGWDSVGGTNATVSALLAADLGQGPRMFAAGNFSTIAGLPAARIAQWDGAAWSEPGGGVGGGNVEALAFHDDGSGPAVFAAGSFQSAGGMPAARIARWDGAGWSAVGAGLGHFVMSLAVHDDGSGLALFAGGWFDVAGGAPAPGVARWDGASWSSVGAGLPFTPVGALAVHDFGTGPRLVAARAAGPSGSEPTLIAWDGAAWTAVGDGLPGEPKWPSALASFDDGQGRRLWVGSSDAPCLHSFGNGAWTNHDVGAPVHGLFAASAGSGTLWATGSFSHVDGVASPLVAGRHACASSPTIAELDGCFAPPVEFAAHVPEAKLGGTLPLGLLAGTDVGHFVVVLSEALVPGARAGGCGVPFLGWGEALLGGSLLVQVHSEPALSFAVAQSFGRMQTVSLQFPADPSFAGVELAFQAIGLPQSSELLPRLSNALAVELRP